MELAQLPAWQMATGIRNGKVSATELLEAHFGNIERWNSKLNAFVSVDQQRARLHAKEADAAVKTGRPLGPLHGVPITIKSSIDVEGLLCEAGTRIRKGYIAPSDAPLVSRLKAAGAIVLGNTTVPEFLMAWETQSALYGRTNSPFDLERTPGGSSGGEAAAIAAYCSAGGIGSDGGGSIRVPAHFCGICGLKPTPGRIPATGHFPPGAGALSWLGVVGPMARTVADVRALFEVMAGPDPGDALSAPVTSNRPEKRNLEGMRVGILESTSLGKRTPETQA